MKARGITKVVADDFRVDRMAEDHSTTSMSALCGRIHLLGEEMPKLTRDEGAVIHFRQQSGFCS
jgi:hypothetical protein